MTASSAPPRIASGQVDAPAALRDALQAAANDGPTPEQFEQLSSALTPIFAVSASAVLHAGATGAASAKLFGASKATTLAVAVVLTAGGYGAWRWLGPSRNDAKNMAPAAVAQPVPELVVPASPPPIPVEQLPLDTEPATETVAPPPRPREATRTRPAEPPAREAPTVEAPKPQLSESELVDLARRLVMSDPRNALALVQDHHRRFAGGPLSEEADFVEIEAMKRLGRFEEARALGDRFRKRYPTSIHGQTVQVRPPPTP